MRVDGVVVLHPAVDKSEGRCCVRDGIDADVIALQGFDEGFGHAVALGAFDRGEAGHELSARAISTVLWAAKIEPLSLSHCTGWGARTLPKRRSTHSTIMSRII